MPGILSELRVLELTPPPLGRILRQAAGRPGRGHHQGGAARLGRSGSPRAALYRRGSRSRPGHLLPCLQYQQAGHHAGRAAGGRSGVFRAIGHHRGYYRRELCAGRLAELGLGHERLSQSNPGLILVSITYFGQDGPYASYQGDDLVAQAMGGYLYAVTGSASQPPMGTALQQMEITAARNGAVAVMARCCGGSSREKAPTSTSRPWRPPSAHPPG